MTRVKAHRRALMIGKARINDWQGARVRKTRNLAHSLKITTICSNFILFLLFFIEQVTSQELSSLIWIDLEQSYCFMQMLINLTVFWCFQFIEKGCIGNKWVSYAYGYASLIFNTFSGSSIFCMIRVTFLYYCLIC